MPGIAQMNHNFSDIDNNNNSSQNLSIQNGTGSCGSFNGSSGRGNGFWSKHRGDVSYNQLQKFWCELPPQARQKLLRIDKQTLFEHARKNLYCSRCNGFLLEGFVQIVMYGKSLQQDASCGHYSLRGINNQTGGDFCTDDCCQDNTQDPSVHPWGGLTTARDGTLTILDCYLNSKSLKGLQNVFDSARARERERELLYPDACGGGGRGWISQGIAAYGRGHGTRESCALHTARLSVETLVDFWSALGEETQQSLLRMKEEDFIERLMYRFDSKRFCRDCRRNVIREFKELKELKRMRKETRCTSSFCVADTAFQYEVSRDTVQADWHQTFFDAFGTYHHFEWAVGTGEGKSDILDFENVGLSASVEVTGLDLSDLTACYITLRAWKRDGRCNELIVKAHALRGQRCVHCSLGVGDGFVTIAKGESIKSFFEHAEEAEEEEDDDSLDKDGNEVDGECSRPQKHAKSPELAREFLLDAATVIFKEQVEKAFREGTARQNAHSIFVSLALKLLEERVHVACKEEITLVKQMKLLEEEENEKREEEERKERRRTKEREKKLRRKEKLRERETRDKKCEDSHEADDVVSTNIPTEKSTPIIDEAADYISETGEEVSLEIQDEPVSTEYIDSNIENYHTSPIREFGNTKYSRRKFLKDPAHDLHLKWSDRRKGGERYESRHHHAEGFESSRNFNGFSKQQLRTKNGGQKLSRCPNHSMSDRYDASRACSCNQNHHQPNEYRSTPSDPSKSINRVSGYNTHKGSNNSSTVKKVWEPRINSDSDVMMIKTNTKAKGCESPSSSSGSSDEVKNNKSVCANQEQDNDENCISTSVRAIHDQEEHDENCKDIQSAEQQSKDAILKDGVYCSISMSSSDNSSSCLSEGDSNNPQNMESTSTSDSEEASQESSSCIENDRDGAMDSSNKREQEPDSSQINVTNSTPTERVNVSMGGKTLSNQSMHYPLFQAPPSFGYYHQSPVSWPTGGPTNGLIPFPNANPYIFPSTYGYGLNGNSQLMQYNSPLQHMPPPLLNAPTYVPVFHPVAPVHGVSAKEVQHNNIIHKVSPTEKNLPEAAKVVGAGRNVSSDAKNNGFSLFHFGGPVALSTGFGAEPVSLKEGISGPNVQAANSHDVDHACNKKDPIEEYSLFASRNGIKFPLF